MDNYIDATYVINLDSDTQRLSEFHSMMSNWTYVRFPAINGKLLYNNTYNLYADTLKNRFINRFSWLSVNEIGCLLSHVLLWEKLATDPNLHRIIIFEDDARTYVDSSTIKSLIHDFYKFIHDNNIQEPDMLYLGKSLDYCINYEKVWNNVYKSTHPLCLHAYIITKSCAQRLLAMAPFSDAIDIVPIKAIEKNLINVMSFHPSLFYQDIFGISIGSQVKGTNSNLRKLSSALNNTTECIIPQQHITGDTWLYLIIIIIGLITSILLFILFIWS